MDTSQIKKGGHVSEYRLEKQIGNGGNSVVWCAKHKQSDEAVAIKFFCVLDQMNRYERFKDEIKVVTSRLSDFPGVVPILQHDLPNDLKHSIPWYSMPRAKPYKLFVKDCDFSTLCNHFISLADTLARLHGMGIAHRDIKPDSRSNWHKGTWVGRPNEAGVRYITRCLHGNFIFAPKAGPFNDVDTYEGNFNSMPAQEMRQIFEKHLQKAAPVRIMPSAQIKLFQPEFIEIGPYVLKYLNADSLNGLLIACDKLKHEEDEFEKSLPEAMDRIFTIDPAALKQQRENVITIWNHLRDEEKGELITIIDFARNTLGIDRWDIDKAVEMNRKSAKYHRHDYFLTLLSSRNNYIRKGLAKLRVESNKAINPNELK